jgi:hypothetical protein
MESLQARETPAGRQERRRVLYNFLYYIIKKSKNELKFRPTSDFGLLTFQRLALRIESGPEAVADEVEGEDGHREQ